MPVKALICDDEAPARAELRFLLGEAGGVEVASEADSAQDALRQIMSEAFDVVFLDVCMPGLSGLELAEVLAQLDRRPLVVFVTAHAEYAVKAFEVAPVDYLMKPVGLSRLQQALGRLDPSGMESALLERLAVEGPSGSILLETENVLFAVSIDDSTYLQTDSDRYLTNTPLVQLESRLAPRGFFRVHRRFLVNLAHVKEIVPMYGGTLLLTLSDKAATQVPVSRRRAAALRRALGLAP